MTDSTDILTRHTYIGRLKDRADKRIHRFTEAQTDRKTHKQSYKQIKEKKRDRHV